MYKTGRLADLISEKEKDENDLVYLEAKYSRKSKRPTTRVRLCSRYYIPEVRMRVLAATCSVIL